jgi:hypothetical protein
MYCKGKDHLAKDCPTRAHLPKHGADAAHENRYSLPLMFSSITLAYSASAGGRNCVLNLEWTTC